jgi:hypothetical protein
MNADLADFRRYFYKSALICKISVYPRAIKCKKTYFAACLVLVRVSRSLMRAAFPRKSRR